MAKQNGNILFAISGVVFIRKAGLSAAGKQQIIVLVSQDFRRRRSLLLLPVVVTVVLEVSWTIQRSILAAVAISQPVRTEDDATV